MGMVRSSEMLVQSSRSRAWVSVRYVSWVSLVGLLGPVVLARTPVCDVRAQW